MPALTDGSLIGANLSTLIVERSTEARAVRRQVLPCTMGQVNRPYRAIDWKWARGRSSIGNKAAGDRPDLPRTLCVPGNGASVRSRAGGLSRKPANASRALQNSRA